MAVINVNAPGGAYAIVIEAGLLRDDLRRRFELGERAIVVSDSHVGPLHGEVLAERLETQLLTMPAGEAHKRLDTVEQLYVDMVNAGADRKTRVMALGGGVVGDTVGFAAATYMRGLPLVQMPTSLLAMVDSSVGGKVGVDLLEGKNLVGAFKQPEVVLIDPDVLQTLPRPEWTNGMAEVLKHGLLANERLLDPDLHVHDHAETLLTWAVQVKVDIVERDPYEQGERAHLNLGHTFAHAIEQVTGYAWPHGQAVGVGLLAAAHLSYEMGLCSPALVDRVDTSLEAAALSRNIDGLEPDTLWRAMKTDKKWQSGRSRFILLRDVGSPLIMEDIPRETVIAVLERLKNA